MTEAVDLRASITALSGDRTMGADELKELYLAIQKFRETMECDLRLNDSERLSLENHIALLQITYMEWKRRNAQKLAYAYRQAA